MQRRKTVLFVDDDVSLLEIVRQLMGHFAGGQWEVLTAPDVSTALGILQEQRVDLLVFDIRMPVVDGLQFLKLLQRKFPNLLKVVLTGYATEETRAACLNDGAELYLEKPSNHDGWQGIHATLHELARFQPEEGFRGVLRQVGLQDVIQMECLARHSVVLKVSAGMVEGKVFVKDGQIVHALFGGQRGEAAFNQILGLAGGDFDLQPFDEPSERTISGQWEFLLMEAARKRDETGEEAPAQAETGPVVIPDLFKPGSTVAAPVNDCRVSGGTKAGAPKFEPTKMEIREPAAAPERALPAETSRPQTDEFLICSAQGEVLHEWKCVNPNGRVSFLEFVSQKARLIAEALPLGEFDRLEVNAVNTRVVAQVQAERALFLRASRVPAEGEANCFVA